MLLIANVAFITSSHGVFLYENETISLGTKLKLLLFLSSCAVFAWPAASTVTERGGESNMALVWGDAREGVYQQRLQEGGVLKWGKTYLKKTLTLHALSTHFNNRPSSQIAVLTPLISTDICSLSSLPPSCFFNQINPNGHPLMASFFRKAERGEIIKIIKPLGLVCECSSPALFFSSCLQVLILLCLLIQAAQREKDSSSSLNCVKLTLGGPIFPSKTNCQCRIWSLGACQLSKCGSRGGRARF